VVEQPIRKPWQENENKQDSGQCKDLAARHSPSTAHHFLTYNAKTTQRKVTEV